MKAYLVSVADAEHTLELAAALLNEGVLPEDLSVIVDEDYADRVDGNGHNVHGPPRIQSDLVTDRPEDEEDIDYASTGNPEMEPAGEEVLDEPVPLYESEIGGGISTASHDDAVSSVEEMDESEEMSEDMSRPLEPRDERSYVKQEFDPEDTPNRNGGRSTATGIHGQEAGIGVGVLAALIPAVVPNVGMVLGDGPLASDLLAEEDKAIEDGVAPFLKSQGLNEVEANKFEAALAAGGGILEVTTASGEASGRQVKEVLESHNHSRFLMVDLE